VSKGGINATAAKGKAWLGNVLALSIAAMRKGYDESRWCTVHLPAGSGKGMAGAHCLYRLLARGAQE
jgi:hypothetical protein